METNYTVGRINFGPPTHTFNTDRISTIVMDEEDTINAIRAELDMMLNSLEAIRTYNTLGKTLKIDQEITTILKAYNR